MLEVAVQQQRPQEGAPDCIVDGLFELGFKLVGLQLTGLTPLRLLSASQGVRDSCLFVNSSAAVFCWLLLEPCCILGYGSRCLDQEQLLCLIRASFTGRVWIL